MIPKQVRLRKSQKDFIDDSALSLSKLVRTEIDKVMEGDREYPTGRTRREGDFTRTSINITHKQNDFITTTDINFSQLVEDVIQERIEIEKALNDL